MEHENALFVDYLYEILDTMFDSVERGLKREGTIPGKLQLPRVAKQMYTQAINLPAGSERETLILSSYAYAVAEENASGQTIVTAPTCGGCCTVCLDPGAQQQSDRIRRRNGAGTQPGAYLRSGWRLCSDPVHRAKRLRSTSSHRLCDLRQEPGIRP